jgi:exosortase
LDATAIEPKGVQDKGEILLVAVAKDFFREFPNAWNSIPNKGLFVSLLTVWMLLFEFAGTSIFGYDSSLYFNMELAYYVSADNVHGFVLPLLVLAMFWWKRTELSNLKARTWLPGMFLILAALGLHVIGYVVQQPRISMMALFFGLYAIIGLVWGPDILRASFFPMCLFAFGIPIAQFGETVTFPLRLLATHVSTFVAGDILGINILQRGTQIIDLNGHFQFEVAAACSGIRSMTAILALCTIYGFMNLKGLGRKLIMVFSAFPLAILGNVLRLVGLIIISEAFGQKKGEYFHDSTFFSLLPYIPTILGILILGHFLKPKETAPEYSSTSTNSHE